MSSTRREALRGVRGVVDLVRRREDRRRLLGERQLPAAAVEDLAPHPGNDHRLGLLAARLGRKLRLRARPEATRRARGRRRRRAGRAANSSPTRCSIERIRAWRSRAPSAPSRARPPGRRSRWPARRARPARRAPRCGSGRRCARRQQAVLDALRRDLRVLVAGGVGSSISRGSGASRPLAVATASIRGPDSSFVELGAQLGVLALSACAARRDLAAESRVAEAEHVQRHDPGEQHARARRSRLGCGSCRTISPESARSPTRPTAARDQPGGRAPRCRARRRAAARAWRTGGARSCGLGRLGSRGRVATDARAGAAARPSGRAPSRA